MDTVDFMKRSMLFAAALLCATAALGQQYKWVDKDGRVQYGDRPPPGVKATRLRSSGTAAPVPPPPAEKSAAKGPLTPAEQEAAFRKRQQDAAKDQEKQAAADQQAQAKKQNCAAAQESLRMLESGQRIARTDAKGERYFLDEQQIAQETAKARQIAAQSCG